jgi:hypothetical protein
MSDWLTFSWSVGTCNLGHPATGPLEAPGVRLNCIVSLIFNTAMYQLQGKNNYWSDFSCQSSCLALQSKTLDMGARGLGGRGG